MAGGESADPTQVNLRAEHRAALVRHLSCEERGGTSEGSGVPEGADSTLGVDGGRESKQGE